jgi:hypothetical protein
LPESVPVLPRDNPAGSIPDVTAKVNGPGGPDAVIAWLYADPTCPAGSDAGATATAG